MKTSISTRVAVCSKGGAGFTLRFASRVFCPRESGPFGQGGMPRGGGGEKPDRSEYNESQELENLQRVFNILVKKECGKITKEQLYKTLKNLNYPKLSMAVVEDLIWEVDEDCDGCISWDEFKAMFYRVRHDKTGWEPRRLFNLVEFMMHDKDQSGSIDMDECMEILFRRFGKDQLEVRCPVARAPVRLRARTPPARARRLRGAGGTQPSLTLLGPAFRLPCSRASTTS